MGLAQAFFGSAVPEARLTGHPWCSRWIE